MVGCALDVNYLKERAYRKSTKKGYIMSVIPREQVVTLTIAAIAIIFIVGGFASMSGLSVYEEPLQIEMYATSFEKGDVFDVNIRVGTMTVLSDETMMIYIDGNPGGAVALKKYFDENRIEYGTEYKQLGTNSVEIMSTVQPIVINLADYIQLEMMSEGSHSLRVEFSRGDAVAEVLFEVE